MGQRLRAEEQAFCEKMYRLFPSDYPKDEEIFKIVEKYVVPSFG